MKIKKLIVHCAMITVLGAAIMAPQISEAGPKKVKPLKASMVFDAEKRKKQRNQLGNACPIRFMPAGVFKMSATGVETTILTTKMKKLHYIWGL